MSMDFTKLILSGLGWFFTGILFYFLLSLLKVHQILYVQPALLKGTGQRIRLSAYPMRLFTIIVEEPAIIKQTLGYLFRYRQENFTISKAKEVIPVKKAVNILDGFTTFLKPFIFFSIVWVFLKLWIGSKLLYAPLQVTLGGIQQLLDKISGLSFLQYINNHKGFVFFFYAIICIAIPYLFDREEKTKRVKRYFTYFLAYLSIIGSISFFGSSAGGKIKGTATELRQLRSEITEIHDHIYRQVTTAVILENTAEPILKEDSVLQELYQQAIAGSLELFHDSISLYNNKNFFQYDSLVTNMRKWKALHLLEEADLSYPPGVIVTHPSSSVEYMINRQRSGSSASFNDGYLIQPETWNKEKGLIILETVKQQFPEPNEAKIDKCRLVLKRLVEAGFDLGLTESINLFFKSKLAGLLTITNHKTLSKYVTLVFSEQFKEKVTEIVLNALSKLNSREGPPPIKTAALPSYTVSTPEELNKTELQLQENLATTKNIIATNNNELLKSLNISAAKPTAFHKLQAAHPGFFKISYSQVAQDRQIALRVKQVNTFHRMQQEAEIWKRNRKPKRVR